jgi:O-6-methylguanine DNA methyltransferase
MTLDRLDDLLGEHFRPEPLPQALAERMARVARAERGGLARLIEHLDVRASARGVVCVRPGRPAASPGAAARRLAERAREELADYFAGRRSFFSVPVDLSGVPDFQRRVLEAAADIPFGESRPYAWVAGRIGAPRAVRAVGTALGRNPVPFIVPCHRVLRSDGSAGGYALGLDVKRRLLRLERTTPLLEGSATTRIVCRVGCSHGRRMLPEHRVVFASVDDARSVGYRPCRVCRPSAVA